MDIKLALDNGATYSNDCWKHYDMYCFDKFGTGDEYIDGWRDTLIKEYKATIHKDSGDRYVTMPEEYYTLFLLKWSK